MIKNITKLLFPIFFTFILSTKTNLKASLNQNLNEKNLGNCIVGISLEPSDTNKAVLLKVKSNGKKSGFLLVGKNQKFYDPKAFNLSRFDFLRRAKDNNLYLLEKELKSSWTEAKNLKPGSRIQGVNDIGLTIEKVFNVELKNNLEDYKIFQKDSITLFLMNSKTFIKDYSIKDDVLSLEHLSAIGATFVCFSMVGAFFSGIEKAIIKTTKEDSTAYDWTNMIADSILLGLKIGLGAEVAFLLYKHAVQNEKATKKVLLPQKTESFAIAKTNEQLKDIINCSHNKNYKINFAKIDVIKENNKNNLERLGYYQEVLCDENGNPIELEDKTHLRLLIAH